MKAIYSGAYITKETMLMFAVIGIILGTTLRIKKYLYFKERLSSLSSIVSVIGKHKFTNNIAAVHSCQKVIDKTFSLTTKPESHH